MNTVTLSLPLEGEYFTTLRLTTGGLCALLDFDVDSAEDFKVCVTESLLILKRKGYLTATIEFIVGETLGCNICGQKRGEAQENSAEDAISHALLCALVGEVGFEKDAEGVVCGIRFEG